MSINDTLPESGYTAEDIARERQALKHQYGAAYDRLLALLFEEDPIGINFGHNADEYDPEVRTILPALASCQTEDEVRLAVHREFCKWFDADTAGPPSRYDRIVRRIITELPQLVGTAG